MRSHGDRGNDGCVFTECFNRREESHISFPRSSVGMRRVTLRRQVGRDAGASGHAFPRRPWERWLCFYGVFQQAGRVAYIVPALQRGNASGDAPASGQTGRWSVLVCVPTETVGTMVVFFTECFNRREESHISFPRSSVGMHRVTLRRHVGRDAGASRYAFPRRPWERWLCFCGVFQQAGRVAYIVPALQRGNASGDAPASGRTGRRSVQACVPTETVGTIVVFLRSVSTGGKSRIYRSRAPAWECIG